MSALGPLPMRQFDYIVWHLVAIAFIAGVVVGLVVAGR
jgi:uncharacterized membrane-anchored protein YhcB (DUF1043 family)